MKLTGKIEGQPVTFELVRQEGRISVFTAEVPANLDGEYVVELTAEDDAGNIAFVCKYLVTIDLTNLCVHLMPLQDYVLIDQDLGYEMEDVSGIYRMIDVSTGYDLQNVSPGYWLEPMYPECALNLGGRL
ncbi:PF13754 domain-containing protein [Anaerostipes faecalis]|uniref:PF13754 domain-containing protein n=1 Tax=Anaerostipes faecalis TaxID=2738446 RepID=UPI003F019EDA